MIRAACIWVALTVSGLPVQAELLRADYAVLASRLGGRLDFESFAAKPEPGINVDQLVRADGIVLGESFQGLPVNTDSNPADGRSDAVTVPPAPADPLTPVPGSRGENLAISLHRGLGSNALYPLGPTGFPNLSALGEGAIAVYFTVDQGAFGFQVHADYVDPLGSRPPPGELLLLAFDRRGTLLARQTIALAHGVMEIGLVRPNERADVAGFVLTNTDPGGVAFDGFIFAIAAPTS